MIIIAMFGAVLLLVSCASLFKKENPPHRLNVVVECKDQDGKVTKFPIPEIMQTDVTRTPFR